MYKLDVSKIDILSIKNHILLLLTHNAGIPANNNQELPSGIDANDGLYQLEKKFKNCFRILNEIGVEPNKMVFVLNKSESLSDDEILSKANYLKFNENKTYNFMWGRWY